MPSGLKRVYGKGDLHFLTFSCFHRLPLLASVNAHDLFVQELHRAREKTGFRLFGYVVMPNHVHLLISEPQTGTVSTVLHDLKLDTSRKFRKAKRTSLHWQMKLPVDQREAMLRAFWQPRFYDFNVHTLHKKKEKLLYMHANLVTRGLVKHPRDWPWSSWSFYAKGEPGLIRLASRSDLPSLLPSLDLTAKLAMPFNIATHPLPEGYYTLQVLRTLDEMNDILALARLGNIHMPNVITFQEALAQSPSLKKRKVLLGNGFSRACKDDIFSYDALFNKANFESLSPSAREAFDALGTTDFEIVIKALRQTALLARVYIEDRPELLATLINDANGIRDVLVDTIARNHPARPREIAPERYVACRHFLDNFACVYTLNYDLLLYWALMQDELSKMEFFNFRDGFCKSEDDDADYVTWDTANAPLQSIHYMHGALHLFDAGAELQKYTWCNTQVALIDQIKAALDRNQFPLFVAEDTYKAKLERIMHTTYLGKCKSSFEKIHGDLFVYGFAFGYSDEHILQLIGNNQVENMFVSLYGDPDSDANKQIFQRVESIKGRRRPKYRLEIQYYSAESAQVWG